MFHIYMCEQILYNLKICLIKAYLSHGTNFEASIPFHVKHVHRRDVVKLVNSRFARNVGHGA
jgi:hypothetical protein